MPPRKKQKNNKCVNLLPYGSMCQKPSSDLTSPKSQGQLCSILRALRENLIPHFQVVGRILFRSHFLDGCQLGVLPSFWKLPGWSGSRSHSSILDTSSGGWRASHGSNRSCPFSLHFISLNRLFCFPFSKKVLAIPCGRWDLTCLTRDGGKYHLFAFKSSGGYTGTTWIIQGNFPILR